MSSLQELHHRPFPLEDIGFHLLKGRTAFIRIRSDFSQTLGRGSHNESGRKFAIEFRKHVFGCAGMLRQRRPYVAPGF
ncbi:hypothetical protein MTBSS4_190026 [Magnetospirillum sp. SS-4]|nr:hypothetical protein MTBSS4_190026 [Magnetospirillum sp. SS-4]